MDGSPIDNLSKHRLVVVTGKGGVGKTVVAAALARAIAERRKKVLLLEVDPRESVHRLLNVPPSGGGVVDVGAGLCLQNLRPRQALDEMISRQLTVGLVARRVLKSEIYHQLAEGGPGLKELGLLRYAADRSEKRGADRRGPFDTVVLDAPATGHGVSLLAAPRLVSEVVEQGPVGREAARLASFVSDPAKVAVVVVTLAEEMPVQEALELREMLARRLGRQPDLLVVNGLYPPLEGRLAPTGVEGDDIALDLWRRRRSANEAELARLSAAWQGPRVDFPLLAESRGFDLVAALRQRLDGPFYDGGSPDTTRDGAQPKAGWSFS
ncbi:MAG: AAA family ATPase [Deltaproteobacteria bacterium]|nr:AAA family ATPase [Deltaproteobacteria bacterium]